jgi:hypothetical protein
MQKLPNQRVRILVVFYAMCSLTHTSDFRFKTLDVLLDMGYDQKIIVSLPRYYSALTISRQLHVNLG